MFNYDEGDILLIATDGLWDHMSAKDVAKAILTHQDRTLEVKNLAIFDEIMQKVSKERNMSIENILKMEPSPEKRRIHDDITMILFDLKH
jgi:serine/threonine protein phosphatase PrpC